MAKLKKGAPLYNRLLHELTVINNSLPENRRLTIKERRKIVSTTLYPAYKDKKARDIKVRDLRKSAERVYAQVPARKDCDVNFLNPALYSLIDWFALDEFIQEVLPKCIYIKVNAGELGSTRVFNTANYGYHGSGVRQIIENIRPEVEDSSGAFWAGYKKLKRGRANDGTPENYYLEFILHVDDQVLADTKEVLYKPKRTKSNIERERTVRQIINERTRKLKNKKNRRRALGKKIPEKIKELRKLNDTIKRAQQSRKTEKAKAKDAKAKGKKAAKKKGPTKAELKAREAKSQYNQKLQNAVKSVERAYNKGDISEKKFQEYLTKLSNLKSKKK